MWLESLGEALNSREGWTREINTELYALATARHTAIVLDPGNNSGGRGHHVHFTDEVIEEHKVN